MKTSLIVVLVSFCLGAFAQTPAVPSTPPAAPAPAAEFTGLKLGSPSKEVLAVFEAAKLKPGAPTARGSYTDYVVPGSNSLKNVEKTTLSFEDDKLVAICIDFKTNITSSTKCDKCGGKGKIQDGKKMGGKPCEDCGGKGEKVKDLASDFYLEVWRTIEKKYGYSKKGTHYEDRDISFWDISDLNIAMTKYFSKDKITGMQILASSKNYYAQIKDAQEKEEKSKVNDKVGSI